MGLVGKGNIGILNQEERGYIYKPGPPADPGALERSIRQPESTRLPAEEGAMVPQMARRYWEDVEVGEEYMSPGRTVCEADIVNFAGVTGDYNEIHTNAELMKDSMFGQRIAHGLLGLSMSSGLIMRMPQMALATLAFMGIRDWRFTGPIYIGDTIRVRVYMAEKRETSKPDRGLITYDRQIINQRGQVVQEGQTTIMVRRRPQ